MSVPIISTAFVGGELAPSLYGRTDLDRYRLSATTYRNGFVNYRGGYYSRGGTLFCGFSKQTGRAYPPRLIPFQFSINQGLALEFGNNYMRVLSDGAFVTEAAVSIVAITQANPAVITTSAFGVATAVNVNTSSVTQSYNVGDTITLAGGTYTTPAQLLVQATTEVGSIFVPSTVSVINTGVYTEFPSGIVGQLSTSGNGFGAQFSLTSEAVSPFNTGDWAFLFGIGGMIPLNGETYVLNKLSPNTFQLLDAYGNFVDSSTFPAFTVGGTASRIYTLDTIYGEQDLPYLKFTQSADAMSICCVNQMTGTEYPAQDLNRLSDTDWVFTPVVPGSPIAAPPSCAGSASTSGSVDYAYEVTAVDSLGNESVASPIAYIDSAVDIASTAGSITLTAGAVAGAAQYNWYKAEPGYSVEPPAGSLFGYAGTSYGTQFIDSNIVADVSQVPPTHQNPFARGQIIGAPVQAGGSGYDDIDYTINTATGSGAVLTLVLVSNALSAIIVEDAGEGYLPTDTITITTATGTGAAATLEIGPQTGTYPSVVSYFQQRRVYGNSENNPDTYWMSKPGLYTNFDTRNPTIDTDAITGSPWAQQVNGIQWMLQTAGGLLVFTGLSAWLLVGAGSFATNVEPISPASQDAVPQAAFGCSAIVPPIKIGYEAIYVNSKNAFYYDQPYQLYTLSEPIDLTESSSHLFVNYTIREHAWCEQPYKLVWAVRNDGVMLSLTFYKAQQVAGWARHDTQGLFQTVCSVTELPVDALYVGTQRFINGNNAYMIERMDNRIWIAAEDVWAVDCGLALAQPTPQASLTASSSTGLGAVTAGSVVTPGLGYSSHTVWTIIDAPRVPPNYQGPTPPVGPGVGAVPTVALNATGGIATISFAPGNQGAGYLNPVLVGTDPTASSGALTAPQVTLTLNNSATFTASSAVFLLGSVGSVIRMGGGIAMITGYTDSEHVTANILSPIVQIIEDGIGVPKVIPQAAGSWTMTAPVNSVTGLQHLAGATVTGLADGNVITPRTVAANGSVTLDAPASAIVIGLGFIAQLQDVRLEGGQPTWQGQRKKVAAVTVRMEASRGIQVGTNQQDGAALNPPQLAPTWADLVSVPDMGQKPYNALTQPLFTGDARTVTPGGFGTPGQVAVQQVNPLPMQILALVDDVMPGDDVELKAPPQKGGQQ